MKKDTAIAILAMFCLTITLFMVSSSMGYDPWADTNDDGKIDMKDIGYEARLFGTSGDPAKPVAIEGYNWTALSHAINVPAGETRDVDVTTAGYRQITLGLNANASGLNSGQVSIATGFVLGNRYANVDRFNLTVDAAGFPDANAMWVEPSTVSIPAVVGYRFNLTVWTNLNFICTAWQFRMDFNKSYFNVTGVGYTGDPGSQFFEGIPTFRVTPIINNDTGYVKHGEATQPLYSREPGNGSLAWVEFELTATPTQNVIFSVLHTDTYVVDEALSIVYPTRYDPSVSVEEIVMPEHTVVRTYIVTGLQLKIVCYNPNGYDVTFEVEGYLTA